MPESKVEASKTVDYGQPTTAPSPKKTVVEKEDPAVKAQKVKLFKKKTITTRATADSDYWYLHDEEDKVSKGEASDIPLGFDTIVKMFKSDHDLKVHAEKFNACVYRVKATGWVYCGFYKEISKGGVPVCTYKKLIDNRGL